MHVPRALVATATFFPAWLLALGVGSPTDESHSFRKDPTQLRATLTADDVCEGAEDCGTHALTLVGWRANARRKAAALAKGNEEFEEQLDRRFFVWLSDVHVDPYYSSGSTACSRPGGERPGGRAATLGCDPPLGLWQSAVEAAARLGHGAEFVLYTGDSVRHLQERMPDPARNVTSVLEDVAHVLKGGFPWLGPDKFVTGPHGNTDSPEDYELNITDGPVNPWLARMASTWWREGVMPQDVRAPYSYGGFFETEVGGLRILSIDTVIYSELHQPADPAPEDPFGQLAWLRARLRRAAAEGRRAWIVGHIPPGTETYSYTPLWRSQYVRAYLDVVEDPVLGNVIAAQLFGHVHADEFRVLPGAPPGAGPLLLTGALSPIYYSNPSFRLVEYDGATGKLLNVKVYWAQIPSGGGSLNWQFGYDYLSAYPILRRAADSNGGLTNQAFASFGKLLWESWQTSGEEFNTYAAWYKTRHGGNDLKCCTLQPDFTSPLSVATKQRYMAMYFCGLNVTTGEQFDACARPNIIRSLATWTIRALSTWYRARRNLTDAFEVSQGYQEARKHLWKRIATEYEQLQVDEACRHMVSVAQSS